MKSILTGLALAICAMSAQAQVTGTATSANTVGSTSAALNAGNSQALGLTYNTDQSGTLKNTPGSVMGAFSGSFSADYCNGTAQATGSGPGLSLGFGGPVKDRDCVAFRGVERTMQVSSTIRPFAPDDSKRLDQAAIDMLCGVETIAPALRGQKLCTLPDPMIVSDQAAARRQSSLYSGS